MCVNSNCRDKISNEELCAYGHQFIYEFKKNAIEIFICPRKVIRKMAATSAVEEPNQRQCLNGKNDDSDRNSRVIPIRTVYINAYGGESCVSHN